MEEHQEL